MAKRAKCPSCSTGFIKGKFVYRLTTDGIVRQRVCLGCAKLAMPVLASDAPSRCENCKEALARVCLGCVGRIIQPKSEKDIELREKARRSSNQEKAKPEEWG